MQQYGIEEVVASDADSDGAEGEGEAAAGGGSCRLLPARDLKPSSTVGSNRPVSERKQRRQRKATSAADLACTKARAVLCSIANASAALLTSCNSSI